MNGFEWIVYDAFWSCTVATRRVIFNICVDLVPLLQEAVSASKAKYKQTLEKKRQAEEIHQPQPEKDREERGDKIRKIAQDAAAKLRAEADEKQRKASEKQQELVRFAAIEYLRQEFGSKGKRQKTCPDSIKEKLQKACRCHLTMPPGAHKEKCNFLPKNLRQIMRNNETDRSNIEAQLRTRTSLSPVQRVAALEHLFGPVPSGSATSSGSPGNFPKAAAGPQGLCKGG